MVEYMTATFPPTVIIMLWQELSGGGESGKLSVYSGQDPGLKRKDRPGEFWKADLCAKQQGCRVHVCLSVQPSIHPTQCFQAHLMGLAGTEDKVMNKTDIALIP